ncbi:hypothetical protein AB0D83_02270 [Streptomyces decoyicus]|uniref:hypothetical protein n=1 Tax=Streptomyces decoyicus TaxID=249567 RepID=UPI0033CB3226
MGRTITQGEAMEASAAQEQVPEQVRARLAAAVGADAADLGRIQQASPGDAC